VPNAVCGQVYSSCTPRLPQTMNQSMQSYRLTGLTDNRISLLNSDVAVKAVTKSNELLVSVINQRLR